MDFGSCLKRILKEKKVSASELARMMSYKSRNSIFRILDGEGGSLAQSAFFDKLMRDDCLHLTQQEREALAQALEVSRVGVSSFLSNIAMREMLMDVGKAVDGDPVLLINGSEEVGDLAQLLACCVKGKRVCLTITGCCDRQIFETLSAQLLRQDIECEVSVTHYVYTGADEVIQNISAIQPMLYASCYTAYSVEQGMFSKERERLYRSNFIFVHAQGQDDRWHLRHLLLVDKRTVCVIECPSEMDMSVIETLLEADRPRMLPLKSEFALNHAPTDYLAYTEDYRLLEHNKPIYTIKLDVPINFIHPDILVPSVLDGFTQTGFVAGEELGPLVEKFYRIHLMRWENFFTKRKATHTIFSRQAMERFARTGVQADHFFAMRPYTPHERVAILQHIREHTMKNPYFKVYFFKEDFCPPEIEIGLYEGMGTLITKAYTHYDLEGDHVEALITQKEFCSKYKEFFTQDLLVGQVLSESDTLKVLDELIGIAQGLAEEK